MAYLTASTFTDIFYIARKVAGIVDARQAVRTCLEAFEICDVTRHTLQHAETLSGNDFEDNLQIACATLQNLDAIVTRDKAGFQNSSVAILISPIYLYSFDWRVWFADIMRVMRQKKLIKMSL